MKHRKHESTKYVRSTPLKKERKKEKEERKKEKEEREEEKTRRDGEEGWSAYLLVQHILRSKIGDRAQEKSGQRK